MNLSNKITLMDDKMNHYCMMSYLSGLPIIDAGANIGEFIDVVREFGIMSKIIAIEPCKSNINILLKKNYDNVEIVGAALVGENNNDVVVFSEIENRNQWGSITNINEIGPRAARARKMRKYKVKSVKLGDIVKSPIDYLKMDIEGEETEVINSLSQELAAKIKQVSLEIHNNDADALDEKLKELGYETQILNGEIFGIRKDVLNG